MFALTREKFPFLTKLQYDIVILTWVLQSEVFWVTPFLTRPSERWLRAQSSLCVQMYENHCSIYFLVSAFYELYDNHGCNNNRITKLSTGLRLRKLYNHSTVLFCFCLMNKPVEVNKNGRSFRQIYALHGIGRS